MTLKNASILSALRDTARAAQFFGVPQPTIRRWRSQGLPASREARFREYQEHSLGKRKPLEKGLLSNTKEVAKFFNVPEPTVRRWRSQGFPAAREQQLAGYRKVETDRNDLKDLLKLLKRTDDYPKVKSFDKDRDGRYTVGFERQEAVEAWLTESTLERVLDDLRGWEMSDAPRAGRTHANRPGFHAQEQRWIATARVSEFGPPAEARVAGYQAIIVPSLKHSKAAQVNFFGVHTSGGRESQDDAIDALGEELSNIIETPGLVLWIHSIYLSSYRHKTQNEITSGETRKRKERGYNQR